MHRVAARLPQAERRVWWAFCRTMDDCTGRKALDEAWAQCGASFAGHEHVTHWLEWWGRDEHIEIAFGGASPHGYEKFMELVSTTNHAESCHGWLHRLAGTKSALELCFSIDNLIKAVELLLARRAASSAGAYHHGRAAAPPISGAAGKVRGSSHPPFGMLAHSTC
jgi:hypothetical protein